MTSDDTTPNSLDDQLDALVAEYSDRLSRGEAPVRADYLQRVAAEARPGLERCLKLIDTGLDGNQARLVAPGMRLGKFQLGREIGRGGMSVVYLSKDPDLNRAIAIKVLRPGLALDQAHVDRFQREGRAIARLSHPGVIPVYEVGEEGGIHWIAMEYVAGPSLATVIEALHTDGEPTVERLARASNNMHLLDEASLESAAARLLLGAVEGLAAAHDQGLVHRDIKPSNILIHPDGRAVLADFGLARAEGDPALSLTGEPLGTPHYMAPEQASSASAKVDERTDVYGLGVTLYELLTGRRPFEGSTVIEVLDAIRFAAPRPLRTQAPWITSEAEAVVRRATMREGQNRYASTRALADDLERMADGMGTVAGREQGGPWSRALAELNSVLRGTSEEFRSARTWLGWPLVHVVGNPQAPRRGAGVRPRLRTAKGWIAIGPKAVGGLAIGGLAAGILSFGGLGFGLVGAFGGLAAGGVSFGGGALGVRAFGGGAVGDVALGGFAVGRGAIGGMAIGKYAYGGNTTTINRLPDEETLAFFESEPEPFRSLYLSVLTPGK